MRRFAPTKSGIRPFLFSWGFFGILLGILFGNLIGNPLPAFGFGNSPFRFTLSPLDNGNAATFSLNIPEGFLLYRDRLSFSAQRAEIQVTWPATHEKADPFENKIVQVYAAGIHDISLKFFAGPGSTNASLTFSFQGCSSKACYMPGSENFPVFFSSSSLALPISSTSSSGVSSTPSPFLYGVTSASLSGIASREMPPTSPSLTGRFQTPAGSTDFSRLIQEQGRFWALIIAFLGGILVSLTPCVYPMIPITLSIIGGRTENTSLRRGFVLSLTYVSGLSLTYALLGIAVATFGAHIRGILQGPTFQLFMATIFALLALSMFDVILLQIPSFIRQKLNTPRATGFSGVFFLGMLSGLMASPCVAAPLAGILAFIAATGSLFMGFFMLLSFAWGMGILLVFIGTFSGSIHALPRAGEWMNRVKEFYGFLLAGVALYFARPVIGPSWGDLGVALLLAAFAAFLGLFTTPLPDTTLGERIRKCWGVVILTLACAFAVSAAVQWGSLTLPEVFRGTAAAPINAKQVAAMISQPLVWHDRYRDALIDAAKNERPILLDFRADWCVICRELEEHVFPNQPVEALLRKMTLMRVDCTTAQGESAELMKRFGIIGLPTLVLLNPDGTERTDLRITGEIAPGDLTVLLRRATSRDEKE
ncbi:MAG: protein-disulfide reductase DsbD [Candidatus Ozemobacteraceae bacterium]